MSEPEKVATFFFWREIGARMGIEDLPASYGDAVQRARAASATRWAHTPGGEAVAKAVAEDYLARWIPLRLMPLGMRAFGALMGPQLRAVHRWPEPGRALELVVLRAINVFLRLHALWPDPAPRPLAHSFGGEYGACPAPQKVGYYPQGSGPPQSARPTTGSACVRGHR